MKPSSENETWLTFDLETDGLYDECTVIHCIVIHDINKDQTFSYGPDAIDQAVDHLSTADVIIGHNIIGYDLNVLQKLHSFVCKSRIIDTLVCTRLIWPKELLYELDCEQYPQVPVGLRGSASLKAWGWRLADNKIDFKDFSTYSQEMLEYCVQDVMVTHKLWQHITKENYPEPPLKLEHDLALAINRQIRAGIPFDVDACLDLVDNLRAKQTELEAELKEIFPAIKQKTIFIPKVNNKTRGYVKGQPFTKVTYQEFNPGSRDQIVQRLKEKYGWQPEATTEKGNPILNDDVLETLPYPEAKPLAEYMLVKKRLGQIADGNNAWLKLVNNDTGRMHGDLVTNGCITGRASHCIEENQLVTQPKGLVPIKDVKPGDYVYSYDEELNLQLNKVLEVIDRGVQECYELKWRTNFQSKQGSLICTANHKIFTHNGWKRLAEISVGDKINHLTVTVSDTEQRKILHMVNRKTKRQCTFIKEKLFNKKGRAWHIHHIDKNKLNDDIANLQLMTASEHMALHGEEDKYLEIKKTKFNLLRMLAKAKGKPTRVPMDFDTFKKKCKENDIDIQLVAARYSKTTEQYITKRKVMHALDQGWSPYRIGIEFGIDWRKSRVDKLLKSHGIINNHWVYEIKYVGLKQTYDLHVENNHNFICEELCVSNSSPNLAQVPAAYSPYGKECRSLFHAPQGWDLIGIDAKALELRCLAGYLALWDGGEYAEIVTNPEIDIHVYNQEKFGVPTRDISKRLLYAVLYSCGAVKAGTIVDPNEKDPVVLKQLGSKAMNSFFDGVPALRRLKQQIDSTLSQRTYLIGLDGRYLHCRAAFKGLNVLLQSAGAIIMKQVVVFAQRNIEQNLGLVYGQDWEQHLFVHDEIEVSCKPQYTEAVREQVLNAFPQAQQYLGFRCKIEGDSRVGKTWYDVH